MAEQTLSQIFYLGVTSGLVSAICLHYFVLPTASRLWDVFTV